MNSPLQLPFYAKLSFTLISVIAFFTIFYFAQGIIVPILIAMLFAVLLRPVAGFLQSRLRLPHILATLLSVLLMVMVIAGIFTFISIQVVEMASDWDKIRGNFKIHIAELQHMIRERFSLTEIEQKNIIDDATKDSMKGGTVIGTTLVSFTDMLVNLLLIPIYTFLFLLYRTHFMKFFAKLVGSKNHDVLHDIMCKVKVSVQSYIFGLMIQMITVSIMTSIGFMFVGLEYAILLGVITGILNLIPYIGILIAGLISIIASLTATPDLSIVIGVIVVIAVTQLIDNNLLVPMIVSSKVQINAFVSIVGIIVGGALAGVAGMFIAIPTIAILKVIFDRVEPLKPWGYLMGDDLPKTYRWRKLQLPLYSYETTTESDILNSEATASESGSTVFTENSTQSNTNPSV